MSIKFIFLLSSLFLSSCGFSPMYGTSSNAGETNTKAAFNQISIAIIPDREGQFLRNALIDRLYSQGEPSNPKYQLLIKEIDENVSDFDLTLESSATRRQLKLTSTMTLIDQATSKPVLSRPLLAITSHNVLDSEFSTLVTEQSARDAALNDMARQIERQLALYFSH